MGNQIVEFKNGIQCEYSFFYADGYDIHMVFPNKSLVEVSQIITSADLSQIKILRDGETLKIYDGYTTIMLLHPQGTDVRVGLRKEVNYG